LFISFEIQMKTKTVCLRYKYKKGFIKDITDTVI